MRVLHIHSGNLYGGVETVLKTLHRYEPVSQEFALCFEGRLSSELRAQEATIWQLGIARTRNPFSIFRARAELRSLLRKRRFDVAVTQMSWAHAIFAPVVEEAGVPVVNWQHNPASSGRWIDHWARRRPPSLVIANSDFVSQSIGWIFPEARRDVLYCPVDLPSGAQLATKSDGQVTIVHASRFDPSKGHESLLRALGRLQSLPGWNCLIAGAPQSAAESRRLEGWKKLVYDLGISGRVEFLGFQSDVPRLLASSSIYCQPNHTPEAFGVSFVEALWHGVPVVTTGFGGALEIVTPECGILTKPADLDDLTSALRLLITSPELRQRMGNAGPRRAEQLCEPCRQTSRFRQLLESVIGSYKTEVMTT